jgi:predicted RNase H-like HicB family nuclease
MGGHAARNGVCIYWSEEDRVFIAEVPELPGCTAHGDTREEALEQAKEAMSLWIEAAQDHGGPVPEPKGRRLFYA